MVLYNSMRFREFIKLEAGAAPNPFASAGKQPSFMRGGIPFAPTLHTPPSQHGVSATQHFQATRQWEQQVVEHILSLSRSKRTIVIGQREFIPEMELKNIDKAARDYLRQQGILLQDSLPLPSLPVDVEQLGAMLQQQPAQGQQQAQSNPQQQWAEFIYNQLYQQRKLLTQSHGWGMTQTYYLPQLLIQQEFPQLTPQVLQSLAPAVGTQEEAIMVAEINTKAAASWSSQRGMMNRWVVGPGQAAGQAALRGTLPIDKAVMATAPRV
jgi:hypothetical protein